MLLKKKYFILFIPILLSINSIIAQTDLELVQQTLTTYIESTANGQPDRLNVAFHKHANLYYVKNDSLKVLKGKDYINNVRKGQKVNRIGSIISIHVVDKIANAIVEIDMPNRKRRYTDFILLSKIENQWKIIHKAFTYKNY